MGFRERGFGFGVWGLVFRGLGFRVLGLRVWAKRSQGQNDPKSTSRKDIARSSRKTSPDLASKLRAPSVHLIQAAGCWGSKSSMHGVGWSLGLRVSVLAFRV